MSQPEPGDHGNSAWAVIAATVLFVVGLLSMFGGSYLVIQGLGHGGDSGGVREVMTGFGGVLLVVGIAHGYAAILIWAHRDAGRSLGILLGGIGTVLGAVLFAMALRSTLTGSNSSGSDLPLLLAPVPHVLVLIGLKMGRDHFPAVSGSRSPRRDER